jgi:hypothetical protein
MPEALRQGIFFLGPVINPTHTTMSSFLEATFAKATVRLAESDAMAALDAEFYDETKKGLPADVQDPMIQTMHGILFGTTEKTQLVTNPAAAECKKTCPTGSSRRKKRKRRGCKIACAKKHPDTKAYAPAVLDPIPAVCKPNGELALGPECLAAVTEPLKACMAHDFCSSVEKGCRNKNGWPAREQAVGAGCGDGTECFSEGGEHLIKRCEAVMDKVKEKYAELKRESGDPRFQ